MWQERVFDLGNATSIPLPWRDLLAQLQDAGDKSSVDLPRTGRELANIAQVLLKTNDENTQHDLTHFINQARVRRDVVVRLIDGAVNRRHKAYVSIDSDKMREKSFELPKDGVPPEIVHFYKTKKWANTKQ